MDLVSVKERIESKIYNIFQKISIKTLTDKSVSNLNYFVKSWKWIRDNIKNDSLCFEHYKIITYQEFIIKLNNEKKIEINYIELMMLIFSIKNNYIGNFLLFSIIDLNFWSEADSNINFFNDKLINLSEPIMLLKEDWDELILKYTTKEKRDLYLQKENQILNDEKKILYDEQQKKIFMLLFTILGYSNISTIFNENINKLIIPKINSFYENTLQTLEYSECNQFNVSNDILKLETLNDIKPPPGLNCFKPSLTSDKININFYKNNLKLYKDFCNEQKQNLYYALSWILKQFEIIEAEERLINSIL
jgi:hypothetical protein